MLRVAHVEAWHGVVHSPTAWVFTFLHGVIFIFSIVIFPILD
jgi:hypothetical protein